MPLGRNIFSRSLILGLLTLLCACTTAPIPITTLALPSPAPQTIPPNALVIHNGTLVDGTGAPPILNGIVVIEKNKIVAVGHANNFLLTPNTHALDARGGTILPGIINAHTHEAASPLIRREYFLKHGVTSVCELGNPIETMAQYNDTRSFSMTARGFDSGPFINVPHGYPGSTEFLYPASNAEQARAAVNDLANRGADMFKIALEPGNSKLPWQTAAPDPIPNLDAITLKALVEQAHARGKLVRVHLGTEEMLDLALDSGVDTIEHVPLPRLDEIEFQSTITGQDFATLSPAYEAKLARMVKQKIVLVPTLDKIITWCESFALTPERQALCRQYAMTPVHRFFEMGGTLALGDDSSTEPRTRMPLTEMRRLVSVGLNPMQVLQASTQVAARVCGHGDELGTLEPGKLADVIVVQGNPLADLDALNRVSIVILGGQIAVIKN